MIGDIRGSETWETKQRSERKRRRGGVDDSTPPKLPQKVVG